jgi:hypothetical protein
MPSVALYAKRSSFEETRDFIILELSGGAVSSRVYCDRVGECRGFVDTTWKNRIEKSPSFCSVEVVQTMDITKTQTGTCLWTGDAIGDKLWNHVICRREYHYRLDFGSIARDDITVEQATPENPQCFVIKSDLPYAVHLNFTKGINARFQFNATGSGNEDRTTIDQEATDTLNNNSLVVGSEKTAQKLASAFKHAAALCDAKKELF